MCSMASILEVCENGCDIIDTAIEPLSWGKVHPDIISVQAMLKDAGFQVPEIDMNAYMKARSMTQEFIDEWLGYFMDNNNKLMSSLLLTSGLPGGMKISKELLQMAGAFTPLRVANLVGAMEVKFTKEELLAMNAKLNKIKTK